MKTHSSGSAADHKCSSRFVAPNFDLQPFPKQCPWWIHTKPKTFNLALPKYPDRRTVWCTAILFFFFGDRAFLLCMQMKATRNARFAHDCVWVCVIPFDGKARITSVSNDVVAASSSSSSCLGWEGCACSLSPLCSTRIWAMCNAACSRFRQSN